jgi:hypothetical protein
MLWQHIVFRHEFYINIAETTVGHNSPETKKKIKKSYHSQTSVFFQKRY